MSSLLAALFLCTVSVSRFFADGMMLQRDRPVPVWGTATPGERVEASFGGKSTTATADAKGNWCVTLPAFPASDMGRDLKVGPHTFKDVVVGDVYLAGGQSNMQFPVCGRSARQHDAKGNALSQIVCDDALRFSAPRRAYAATPANDVALVWRKSRREDLWKKPYEGNHEEGSISAVAWSFARYVREAAKVPVGFVDVSRGGAFIEPSMPPAEVARAKELRLGGSGHQAPGVMWNAMIAPMARFPFKGVLWYQGESNKNDTNGVYLAKLRALVGGWRREFGNPVLPFYYVQLAPYSAGHLAIQLQQAEYEKEDPNAAMVVVADIGNLRNIHPRDKDTVGLRLALRALKREYGFDDMQDASPEVRRATCDGSGKVSLEFANAKWLYVLNEDMSLAADFELMDSAGKWHAARIVNFKDSWIWWSKKYAKNGEFEGNSIELAAGGVAQPKAVRYLFNSPWQGSVFNEAALPLGPFAIAVEECPQVERRNSPIVIPANRLNAAARCVGEAKPES